MQIRTTDAVPVLPQKKVSHRIVKTDWYYSLRELAGKEGGNLYQYKINGKTYTVCVKNNGTVIEEPQFGIDLSTAEVIPAGHEYIPEFLFEYFKAYKD